MDLADLARLDQFPDLDADGKVARPHGLHEEDALLLGHGDELLGLGGRHGQGLFAEDILAGHEGEHGVLEVVAVGSGDVDDVDVRVVHKLLVGAIGLGRARDAELVDELGGAVLGAGGGDSGDLVADIVDVTGGGVVEEVLDKGCCLSDTANDPLGGRDSHSRQSSLWP